MTVTRGRQDQALWPGMGTAFSPESPIQRGLQASSVPFLASCSPLLLPQSLHVPWEHSLRNLPSQNPLSGSASGKLSLRHGTLGLPWWSSGWEFACQCRGCEFDPWSEKIPCALGPLSGH